MRSLKSKSFNRTFLNGAFIRKNFRNFASKVFKSSEEAIADIKSGSRILTGGFGISGIPENLIYALSKRKDVKDLEVVSNNGGVADWGNGLLLASGQVRRLTGSYVGENKILESKYLSGELELNLIPQGTLAEKLRCGGAGIPAFYTPTGYGTQIHEGGFPIKLNPDPKKPPLVVSQPKPVKQFNGRNYIEEEAIIGDFALVKAYKGDKFGNLIFRKSARNFNQDCASAARVAIAEVEHLVEPGELNPDEIHCPGIYIHRIIQGEKYERRIEKLRDPASQTGNADSTTQKGKIARRAAEELTDGMYVNLGIGIPNLVSDFIPEGVNIQLQSENGILGIGPYPEPGQEDPDLVSAIKEPTTETTGCSYFKSSDSFAMIRGGKVDVTILGALQVAKNGDLANWIIPGKLVKGMGGAMDLVGSGSKVIVTMEHVAKGNTVKILDRCKLPLTGKSVVNKLITDLAVFEFKNGEMILTDLFKGVNLEKVKELTGCEFKVAQNIRILDY